MIFWSRFVADTPVCQSAEEHEHVIRIIKKKSVPFTYLFIIFIINALHGLDCLEPEHDGCDDQPKKVLEFFPEA